MVSICQEMQILKKLSLILKDDVRYTLMALTRGGH